MSAKNPSKAELAKFRRKLNRAIKKGAKGLGKSARKLQSTNIERNTLIQGLNGVIDTGSPAEQAGARTAKKRLSVNWQNRSAGTLTGFWNPNEASK